MGAGVAVGASVTTGIGCSVEVGAGGAVGTGFATGTGVAVGTGVAAGPAVPVANPLALGVALDRASPPPPTPSPATGAGDVAPCTECTTANAIIGAGTAYSNSNNANGAAPRDARRMPGIAHHPGDCLNRLPIPRGFTATTSAATTPIPATNGPITPSTTTAITSTSTTAATAINPRIGRE